MICFLLFKFYFFFYYIYHRKQFILILSNFKYSLHNWLIYNIQLMSSQNSVTCSDSPYDNIFLKGFNFLEVFFHHQLKGIRLGSVIGFGLIAQLAMIIKFRRSRAVYLFPLRYVQDNVF